MSWQARVKNLALDYQNKKIVDFFKTDADRSTRYTVEVNDIYLDYSKNILDDNTLLALLNIAKEKQLSNEIEKLFQGEKVNQTENRPALHTALRQSPQTAVWVDGKNVIPSIVESREKMSKLVHQLRSQDWQGATKKPIKYVVNLGIGGSDLGPKMVCEALSAYQEGPLSVYFVSNVDPSELMETLEKLDPAQTLFIIASKSFTTIETLTNANVAKNWLKSALNQEDLSSHFVAVTAKPEKAKAWGMLDANILSFEDWVGGRYSVWSTIGLPVALTIGMANFEDFLAGARAMDEHFRATSFDQNMPVLLALVSMWYIHGFEANTQAILPYAHGLRSFPDYLQQLDMESNGKSIQKNAEIVKDPTGPIVWGQAGTNGQHAFYQLLHQGTHFIPMDFIVFAKTNTHLSSQHEQLVANALAQAQAFMQGEVGKLPHDHMPGNKPSNFILLNKLTPFALGELLALYEHKVFVQGVLWEVNSFDQPGVELGKKLANKISQVFASNKADPSLDPSTQTLIQKIKKGD